MSVEGILALFLGGGGLGVIITAWLTRRTSREEIEINLLDRAYVEIDRLDAKIDDLMNELEKKIVENDELGRDNSRLEEIVADLKTTIELLRSELDTVAKINNEEDETWSN